MLNCAKFLFFVSVPLFFFFAMVPMAVDQHTHLEKIMYRWQEEMRTSNRWSRMSRSGDASTSKFRIGSNVHWETIIDRENSRDQSYK